MENKRIFLLGSGFSKLSDLPLTNELVDFIIEHLKKSPNVLDKDNEILKFLEEIKNNYPWLTNDIELLFTYIDLALLKNSVGIFSHFNYSLNNLKDIRMKLSGVLVRAFKYTHFEFWSTNRKITQERKEADQIFWKFCEQLNKGDTVITFNYDLIVERGLWLQNKWTFLDGYGFTKDINEFQDSDYRYPPKKPKESLIKVYKLHGSLGWYRDKSKRQIIFGGMGDYFPDYTGFFCEGNLITAMGTVDEGTTFIEPTYIKQFDYPIILDIWNKSFHEIQQCNELFIIGYSLPEADSAARILLATGVRSSQASSITVVNRDNTVFDKFDNLFGRKVVRRKMIFKEWMENEN